MPYACAFCALARPTTAPSTDSPDIIVHPSLESTSWLLASGRSEQEACEAIVSSIEPWLGKLSALLVGPGLGRDAFVQRCAREIILRAKAARLPVVLDADALWLACNEACVDAEHVLAAAPRGAPVVVTPNHNEFRLLVQHSLATTSSISDAVDWERQLSARWMGLGVLRKGVEDSLVVAGHVASCATPGSARRCGGQGDILSGLTALFLSWSAQACEADVLGAMYGAAHVTRLAAAMGFAEHGRGLTTADIITHLPRAMAQLEHAGEAAGEEC